MISSTFSISQITSLPIIITVRAPTGIRVHVQACAFLCSHPLFIHVICFYVASYYLKNFCVALSVSHCVGVHASQLSRYSFSISLAYVFITPIKYLMYACTLDQRYHIEKQTTKIIQSSILNGFKQDFRKLGPAISCHFPNLCFVTLLMSCALIFWSSALIFSKMHSLNWFLQKLMRLSYTFPSKGLKTNTHITALSYKLRLYSLCMQ